MAKARQQYFADETSIAKDSREFAITPEILEKINSIEPWAQVNVIETIKVNWEALTPDENKAVDIDVPLVDDTLYSTSSEDALSARQWRILYDYIQNLQSRWRFLSNWNCVTWLATTNPADNPYQYRTWDYYLVSNVAALGWTNYRPNGSQYIINQASTTVESQTVKVSDMYIYDGTNWLLLVNTDREIAVDSSLSTTSTNPVENRVVTNALNWKQDTISDLAAIRAGAALWDTALQPGDSLSQLTWTSDDISEWSTNLFMTTTERSKLSNQSWVNTWDETQTTIKNKLWQASTSTDGYLTSTDWNTFNWKQDAISDLAIIRSNASAWKSASDTIATYWDIVTHDVSEFATAAQWGLADTALQPNDNISELTNDVWYVTDAYHDSTKQDVLIAGNNIQIAADGKTISATDTTYTASDFDIKDLTDSTGLRTEWSWKQDELVAWTNIQIAADGKTISATDTTYSAWVNVSISNNNVISATDNKAVWWNITGTLSDQTDLNTALSWKQDTLIAWSNVQIASDGKTISATDTTYTAGTWISIDANNVISNTQTSAEWWNITWTLADQTDLQNALNAKQDNLVAGTNIQIAADWKTISATDTTYTASDFDIKDLTDSTSLRSTWSAKQDALIAGTNIQIAADWKTISATDTTYTATDFDIKDLADSTSLRNTWSAKQDTLIAGTNIQIAADGKTISATDTTYTATDFDIKDLTDSTGLRTTWSWKQDAISDLATIRTWAGKGATAVQPLDNVSTLTNDAWYITKSVNDLTNYYTKSETYTKSEVADLVANFAWFKVVATLPTTDIKTNIIYLLWPVWSWADKYEEYIYSNNTWVMIWETSVDLTNYFNTSTQTSDAITQWSTNLFLTSAERTKLWNTSWTNTWDETKTTIQTKLWAASASNSWYLTSTDWSTFNSKADSTIIDDTAYASSWDADTTHAPTKNAVYDKISAMDTTIWNKANTSDVLTKTNTTTYTPSENYHPATKKYVDDAVNTASGWVISDTAYWSSWDWVSTVAPSKNAVYDKISAMDTTIGWKQDTLIAGTNIQIAADWKTISATDTTYTAWTWIDITNWVISNTQTSAEWGNISWTLSDQTDLQSALDAKQDDMVILKYGISTWNDFITAYNKNAIVYCRASSQSNPASGAQTRLAFMAYVNQETNPTSVEFQYYRSRSDHNSAANQLDEVYVYKLESTNWWKWTVEIRNTAAKAVAGTWIWLSFGSGNMTINADAQYDDTAYWSSWNWVTDKAPTKNAVYDKISAMDTTISNKANTADLWTAAYKNTWTSSGNVPVLDSNGKLNTTVLPALAITDTFTVTNASDLTGLTSAEKWDVWIVTSESKTYILSADPYSTAANWKELATPTDTVTSVNSKTGAVTLDADDISDTSTTNKFVTSTEKSTWNAKQNALTTQTAYTSKGSATKVPQITTNTLGQVTGITEVDIVPPTIVVSDIIYWSDWEWVTERAPSKNVLYEKLSAMDTTIAWKQNTLTAWENIKISNNVISANNAFIITEDDVTVSTDDTKWVSPYNTSYGYTNIDISANAGIEWREWAIYSFVVNTEMVVASDYRNVRVRIWNWNYIPMKNRGNSILSWSSYMTKGRTQFFVYKTVYETWGALHMTVDTSYSSMSASEATTWTATSARTISASVLKWAVQTHSPVKSVNWQTGAVTGLQTTSNLKTSLSDNSDSYYPSQKAVKTAVDGKQDALSTQTAYTSKWTSTKVPTITTNTLWQVTSISETSIAFPVTSVNGSTWAVTVNAVPWTWTTWHVLTKTANWYEFAAPSWWWDMNYADFNATAATWATVTMALNTTITPSANFTVNAPSSIKDWQVYILRVTSGSTVYTMTLWTNMTNPYDVDTTLTANWLDQFVFFATWGKLELQPEWWGGSWWAWITNNTTGTTTTVTSIWAGTEAEYASISVKDANVLYFTF